MKNNKKIKNVKSIIKKYSMITLTLLLALMLSVGLITKSFAANIEMPKYIRVKLISSFANKARLNILNTSIYIGYDRDNYTYDANYSCAKGFYLERNTSTRYVSQISYSSFSDVLSAIDGSNDYIPVFVGENEFKIATKAGREASDLASMQYNDANSIVLVSGDNKETAIFMPTDFPLIASADDEDVKVVKLANGKSYRGYMQIIKDTSGISAINHVNFENYLYGVINSEMPSSWPLEANKAQTLTARTFAYKKILAKRYPLYDVVDTVQDQVYGGYNKETEMSKRAVDETRGEIIIYVGDDLAYKNKPIDAFFFSSSGGVTEASENVWTAQLPYCKSVDDTFEGETKYSNWTNRFTVDDLQNAMNKKGEDIGTVTGCTVTLADESQRVVSFNVIGTKGTFSVKKDSIRTFFTQYMPDKINSNNFTLTTDTSSIPNTKEAEEREIYVASTGMVTANTYSKLFIQTANGIVENIDSAKDIYVQGLDTGVIKSQKTVTLPLGVIGAGSGLNKGEYLITGSGYGHGVGMSQYGAKAMAESGYSYADIIKHYYTDVEIEDVD